MKVIVKEGVIFKEVNARLMHLCVTSSWIWDEYGSIPVITSANDGKHMATSLHYKDLAWDLRVKNLPDPQQMADRLREMLNVKHHDYDVLFGDEAHKDHIHVEYQPK
jgi:hypothetical protein